MLTADLVRATIKGGVLRPSYVAVQSEQQLERAEALVATFQEHVERQRGELDEALAAHIGDATDYKLQKGLIKLLTDRCTFATRAATEPKALRARLFFLAAERGPIVRRRGVGIGAVRADLVAEVAGELGVDVSAVEDSLFADLRDSAWLEAFEPLTPEQLLNRYNTALAQGIILRAHGVTVRTPEEDPKRWRALLRAVKFFGLSHRITREGGEYRIELDGPLSLFRYATKYGVRLASFLPALLHADAWSLEADVEWGQKGRRVSFRLDPEHGLRSHTQDRGTWSSEEEQWLLDRLRERPGPWTVDTSAHVVQLDGGDVVVPDLVLRHEDGREALVEIIWFWRKASLAPRLASLAKAAPPNLLLAVSDGLRVSKDDVADFPVPVVRFKDTLPAGKLLALAEQVAR